MSPQAARAVVEELVHDGSHYLVIGYRVPRPAILAKLTPSELEVMDTWLSGASAQSIAAQRKSAIRTVANQIASVYRKLGVGSRGELLARLQAGAL